MDMELTAMIAAELYEALAKLGGNSEDLTALSGTRRELLPAKVHELFRRHFAGSDLLGIIGSWKDTQSDAWVLESLRRWNAMLHRREGDVIHFYEPMTPEKRPQDDPAHDGSGLTFVTLEHGGRLPDNSPQVIDVLDAAGRTCRYLSEESDDPARRPQDDATNTGESLRVEPFDYGGEYPDDMPNALLVSDVEGRSAVYRAITVDGKVVDSKFFRWLKPARGD